MPSPDRLADLSNTVTLFSPFVLGAVIIAASLGPNPHQRRLVPGLAWLAGVLAGLLGAFHFESPDRDGLENLIRVPFLFSKWFVLGFAPIWLGCTLRNQRSQRPHFAVQGLVAMVWLAVGAATVTGTLVVTELYQRDIDYWNRSLDPATPAIDLSEARAHFSRQGRARIEKILQDRPHTVQSEVLRSLDQLGVKQVVTAKQVSPDVIATAAAKIPRKGPLSHYDTHTMMELAKNPALDDATFLLLCERGDNRVLSVLTRNQGNDDARLQRLLREVQQRSAQAEKNPRTIEADPRNLRDLARRIEARRTEPKPPPTSVTPPEDR